MNWKLRTAAKTTFGTAVLLILWAPNQSSAADPWVAQAGPLTYSPYVLQAPAGARRYLVTPQPQQSRRQQRQRTSSANRSAPASQTAVITRADRVLDLSGSSDSSRLPSVREGVRIVR